MSKKPNRGNFPPGPNGNNAYQKAIKKGKWSISENNKVHNALRLIAREIAYHPGLHGAGKNYRSPLNLRLKTLFMAHKNAQNKLEQIERNLERSRGGHVWMNPASPFHRYSATKQKILANVLKTRAAIYYALYKSNEPNNVSIFFIPRNGGRSINNLYRETTRNMRGIYPIRKKTNNYPTEW